jgi:phenylpropionate dioxygenase-like ring-hydroxylating dioxygenase large terminal subunit
MFIVRNKDGVLNAFINACSHRGATMCRHLKKKCGISRSSLRNTG